MAADSALLKSSLALTTAQSGVGAPNLKPLYTANTLNLQKGLGMITGVIAKLEKEDDELMAGKELASKNLQTSINNGMKSIYELNEPLPEVIVAAVRNHIKELQQEFDDVNTYGKGDNEENQNARNRIEGELNRVINAAKGFREGIGIIGNNKDKLDLTQISYGNLDPITMGLDIENMDKNAQNGLLKASIVNGKISLNVSKYSTRTTRVPLSDPSEQFLTADSDNMMDQEEKFGEPKDLTMDSMIKTLAIKKTGWDTGELKWYNNAGGRVSQDFSNGINGFNIEEETAQIAGTIKDENDFKNIAKRNIEGFGSQLNFKRSLIQSGLLQRNLMEKMFVNLDDSEMGIEDIFIALDADGDGDVDLDDSKIASAGGEYIAGPNKGQVINEDVWLQNSKTMINAITDTEADGFNLNVSRDLASQYFAGMRKQKYDNEYTKLEEAARKNDKENDSNTNGFKFNVLQGYRVMVPNADGTSQKDWVSGQLIVNAQDFINDMVEGSVLEGYDGNVYRVKDGKFFQGDKMVQQSRISKNLGIWSYGYEPKDTYELEVKKDPIYEPSTYIEGNYVVGKKRHSTIGEAIGTWERDFKKKNKEATKQEIADAVAAERILMQRAQ